VKPYAYEEEVRQTVLHKKSVIGIVIRAVRHREVNLSFLSKGAVASSTEVLRLCGKKEGERRKHVFGLTATHLRRIGSELR